MTKVATKEKTAASPLSQFRMVGIVTLLALAFALHNSPSTIPASRAKPLQGSSQVLVWGVDAQTATDTPTVTPGDTPSHSKTVSLSKSQYTASSRSLSVTEPTLSPSGTEATFSMTDTLTISPSGNGGDLTFSISQSVSDTGSESLSVTAPTVSRSRSGVTLSQTGGGLSESESETWSDVTESVTQSVSVSDLSATSTYMATLSNSLDDSVSLSMSTTLTKSFSFSKTPSEITLSFSNSDGMESLSLTESGTLQLSVTKTLTKSQPSLTPSDDSSSITETASESVSYSLSGSPHTYSWSGTRSGTDGLGTSSLSLSETPSLSTSGASSSYSETKTGGTDTLTGESLSQTPSYSDPSETYSVTYSDSDRSSTESTELSFSKSTSLSQPTDTETFIESSTQTIATHSGSTSYSVSETYGTRTFSVSGGTESPTWSESFTLTGTLETLSQTEPSESQSLEKTITGTYSVPTDSLSLTDTTPPTLTQPPTVTLSRTYSDSLTDPTPTFHSFTETGSMPTKTGSGATVTDSLSGVTRTARTLTESATALTISSSESLEISSSYSLGHSSTVSLTVTDETESGSLSPPTETLSFSQLLSLSGTNIVPATDTSTLSYTKSASEELSMSRTPSNSDSVSFSFTESESDDTLSQTATPARTVSPSLTVSTSVGTGSSTESETYSLGLTVSVSVTPSKSASRNTITVSTSGPSDSNTESESLSYTASTTQTGTDGVDFGTESLSLTTTVLPTSTLSLSTTRSDLTSSSSHSITWSVSPSSSETLSISVSTPITMTGSLSNTLSLSLTDSGRPSASKPLTTSPSLTRSKTPRTRSSTHTETDTAKTFTPTDSPKTGSPTKSTTTTETASVEGTKGTTTVSYSFPSESDSLSPSISDSESVESESFSVTASDPTLTTSYMPTLSETKSDTGSLSLSETRTGTNGGHFRLTHSWSDTIATWTDTESLSFTVTSTASDSLKDTDSRIMGSNTRTDSDTGTFEVSVSSTPDTKTVSYSVSDSLSSSMSPLVSLSGSLSELSETFSATVPTDSRSHMESVTHSLSGMSQTQNSRTWTFTQGTDTLEMTDSGSSIVTGSPTVPPSETMSLALTTSPTGTNTGPSHSGSPISPTPTGPSPSISRTNPTGSATINTFTPSDSLSPSFPSESSTVSYSLPSLSHTYSGGTPSESLSLSDSLTFTETMSHSVTLTRSLDVQPTQSLSLDTASDTFTVSGGSKTGTSTVTVHVSDSLTIPSETETLVASSTLSLSSTRSLTVHESFTHSLAMSVTPTLTNSHKTVTGATLTNTASNVRTLSNTFSPRTRTFSPQTATFSPQTQSHTYQTLTHTGSEVTRTLGSPTPTYSGLTYSTSETFTLSGSGASVSGSGSESLQETVTKTPSVTETPESLSITDTLSSTASPMPTPTISITHSQSANTFSLSGNSESISVNSETFTETHSIGTFSETTTLSMTERTETHTEKTHSTTQTITITPGETLTTSDTLSLSDSHSGSFSESMSRTFSLTPVTWSLTKDTFTLTETGSVSNSESMSLSTTFGSESVTRSEDSMSFSQTTTASGSSSDSLSFSVSDPTESATKSITETPPETPSETLSFTASPRTATKTFPVTESLSEELSLSESLSAETVTGSASDSLMDTLTFTTTPTGTDPSVSLSETKDTITKSARYTFTQHSLLPSSYNRYFFSTNHPLTMRMHNVPLDPDYDQAALLDISETSCYGSPVNGGATFNPLMKNFTLTTHFQNPNGINQYSNWTIPKVSFTGTFRVCYWLHAENKWYSIDKPYYAVIAAWADPNTYSSVNQEVAVGPLITVTSYGGNATLDSVELIPWGQDCNDPLNSIRTSITVTKYAANQLTVTGINIIKKAKDFSVCYMGYPYDRSHPAAWQQLNAGMLRMVGSAALANVLTGAPVRTYKPLTLQIVGHGLNIWDSILITNNTVARCSSLNKYTLPSQFVAKAWVKAYGLGIGAISGRTTLDVSTMIEAPGTNVICYKGNTSEQYLEVSGALDVAPIRPLNFTPVQTAANYTPFVVGSEIVLQFWGEADVDSQFDTVTLHAGESDCTDSTYVQTMSPWGGPDATMTNQWVTTVATAQNYSVCFASNVTQAANRDFIGKITVKRYFNERSVNNSALDTVFSQGAFLGTTVQVNPYGMFLNPMFDQIYMTKKNLATNAPACFAVPPSNFTTYPIARTNTSGNITVDFKASTRGYYVFCYVTAMGYALESEVFVVFPEPPTSFTPNLIGHSTDTLVTFSGGNDMDITDGDVIVLCGSNTNFPSNWSVTPLSARTATFNIDTLGSYDLCFTSGVFTPGTNNKITWPIGSIGVSPIVYSATASPMANVLKTAFTVTLTGKALGWNDALFTCHATNSSLLPAAFNSTAATYGQQSLGVWKVIYNTAGTRRLCYWKGGRTPSFDVTDLNLTLTADPKLTSLYPSTIQAAKVTDVNFTGTAMEYVQRVFIRTNGTQCDTTVNPFDVEMLYQGVAGAFSISLPSRGSHLICYRGISENVYEIESQVKLSVVPHVQTFAASQDTVSGTILSQMSFYAGYPINIALQGGGLQYELDTFYAVQGTTCAVDHGIHLKNPNPPLSAVTSLPLSFIAPTNGDWFICHRLGTTSTATMVPSMTITVISSLVYTNTTLTARGPAVQPSVLYAFQFTTTVLYTPLQSVTASNAIAVPYSPVGLVSFRCQVIGVSGTVLYNLTTEESISVEGSTFCAGFPQVVTDADKVKKFAMSMILIYNYVQVKCFDILPADSVLDASKLLVSLLKQIAGSQSLVIDIDWVFTNLADAIVNSKQNFGETIAEVELLLTATAGTLNRPDAQMTDSLLGAHVKIAQSAAYILEKEIGSGTDGTKRQALGLNVVDRLSLVARRFCATARAAQGKVLNATANTLGVGARFVALPNKFADIEPGFGVTTTPHMLQPIASKMCLCSNIFLKNFMGDRDATAARAQERLALTMAPGDGTTHDNRRAMVEQASTATVSSFNLPVLMFQLPSGTSSADPLNNVDKVIWQVPITRVTRQPGHSGSGYTVEGNFYRFVRDGTTATSGTWKLDVHTTATADETTNIMTITHDHVAANTNAVTKSGEVMISGTYEIVPVSIPPVVRRFDFYLIIFICVLVVLHIIMAVAGHLLDIHRDNKYEADQETMDALQTGFTFHRYLSLFNRKPHQAVSTARRVTSMFTFLFANSMFALIVAEYAEWNHHPAWNGALAIPVLVLSTPPAALVRVILQRHLRDFASGLSALIATIALGICLPLEGPFWAAILAGAFGIFFFVASVAFWRSRWSFQNMGDPGPSPMIFGTLFHVLVEVGAIVLLVWRSIDPGTPIIVQDDYHFYQIFVWAMVFDFLIEVVKNKIMFIMSDLVNKFDEKRHERDDFEEANIRRLDSVVAGPPRKHPTARQGMGSQYLEEYVDDEGSSALDDVTSADGSSFLDVEEQDGSDGFYGSSQDPEEYDAGGKYHQQHYVGGEADGGEFYDDDDDEFESVAPSTGYGTTAQRSASRGTRNIDDEFFEEEAEGGSFSAYSEVDTDAFSDVDPASSHAGTHRSRAGPAHDTQSYGSSAFDEVSVQESELYEQSPSGSRGRGREAASVSSRMTYGSERRRHNGRYGSM